MRISFMGFDWEEKQRVVGEMTKYFEKMGLKVYAMDYITQKYNALGEKFKEPKARKKIQRWIDYWFVYTHYFNKNFVASASIYDAWATARISVHPWYHDMLYTWAYKHIWYDHIFYILPTGPVDPVRSQELNSVVQYARVPFHILTGSTKDKIDQVKVILGVF